MKVCVTLAFDANLWAEEYGMAKSEVREDFLNWLTTAFYNAVVPIEVRR